MTKIPYSFLQSGLITFFSLFTSFSHAHVFDNHHYLPNINTEKTWATQLPNLHNQNGLVDKQQSLKIGEYALRQLNSSAPIITDPWLQESLQQILWQLNAVARQDAPLALLIINDKQINAFAIPSGLIGINIGLIDKARSLDEVASVMAHEIAHISQRHYQHRNDEKNKQLALQIGSLLAGIIASQANSEVGSAVMIGTQAMSANTTATFSRSQEQEADRIGMQIMAEAGYDVHAMGHFFTLLNQQNQINTNAFIPSFILSHPLTTERLSEANLRANQYPKNLLNHTTKHYRQQLFDQIQWRGRYLAKLVTKTDLLQAAKNNDGAKLALIMQLIDEHQLTKAEQAIQFFAKDIENLSNPLAVIVSAHLNQKQGKYQQSIQKLTSLHQLMPERRDIKLYLADAYLNQNPNNQQSAQTVIHLLQPLSQQNVRDIEVWQRLQQANQILARYSQGNEKILHEINVLRYRSQIEYWKNDSDNALTSLNHAKKLANTLKSPALISTINQQIQLIQQTDKYKP